MSNRLGNILMGYTFLFCNLFNRQSREEAVRTVRELGATLRFLTRIGE